MKKIENIYQKFDGKWDFVLATKMVSVSNKVYSRIVNDAKEFLGGFDIDFSKYGEPKITMHEESMLAVEWTNLKSGRTISLNKIYFDEKTGAILQCGENYGNLVS